MQFQAIAPQQNMNAFRGADLLLLPGLAQSPERLVRPGTGRAHYLPCPDSPGFAGKSVPHDRAGGSPVLAHELFYTGVVMDLRSASSGIENNGENQPGVVGYTVVVQRAARKVLLPHPGSIVKHLLGRQTPVLQILRGAREMVIQPEPERDSPLLAFSAEMRQQKWSPTHQTRGQLRQNVSLGDRFMHEAQAELLQVAQAAVNQLGAPRAGPAGEVPFLDQNRLEASRRSILGDPRSRDASSDHEQIRRHFFIGLRHPPCHPVGATKSMNETTDEHGSVVIGDFILRSLRRRKFAAKARRTQENAKY